MEFGKEIVGLFAVLATLFSGVIGSAVAYILTREHQIRREKVSRTIQMIDRYSDPEFIKIRNKAGRMLREQFKVNSNLSWTELHKTMGDNWQYVSQIEHFYKVLYFLAESGLLDRNLAQRYFLAEHDHWYKRYFYRIERDESVVKKKFDSKTQLELNNWLCGA